MRFHVYYEDIDGQLQPQWLLVPAFASEEAPSYSLTAPFERFYPEDFNDHHMILSVSQGALMKNPAASSHFSIHLPTVQRDLTVNGHPAQAIYGADFFLIRMEDLEEVLQMDVRGCFKF